MGDLLNKNPEAGKPRTKTHPSDGSTPQRGAGVKRLNQAGQDRSKVHLKDIHALFVSDAVLVGRNAKEAVEAEVLVMGVGDRNIIRNQHSCFSSPRSVIFFVIECSGFASSRNRALRTVD